MNPKLSTVRQGAAENARNAKKNPLALLNELKESYPTAEHDRIKTQWRAIVENDYDYLSAALDNAFTNYLRRLDSSSIQLVPDLPKEPDTKKEPPKETLAERRARLKAEDEELKKQAELNIEKFAEFIFMEMILPNGKKLCDATSEECGKAGGFYVAISKLVKPGHTVSQDLSEDDLRKIFRAQRF